MAERKPKMKKLNLTVSALVLIVNVAFTQTFTIIDSIRGVGGIPFGLEWDGAYLWHANRGAGHFIYKLNPIDGSVVYSFPSPGTDPAGVAWDGQYLWHTDWSGNMVYKIDVSTGTPVFSFPMNSPKSIEWDGNSLWISDAWRGIYRVDPTNGTTIALIEPGYWVVGLSYDGTNFWINGQYPEINGERKIYKMTQAGEIIESYDWPRYSPGGLAWDGQDLWVSDYNGWIYKVGAAEKRFCAGLRP
jgi:DNA-binding beta-propeller fold protein YncE